MHCTTKSVILSKRSAPKDLAAKGRILRRWRKDSSTRLRLAQNDNIFFCRSNYNLPRCQMVTSPARSMEKSLEMSLGPMPWPMAHMSLVMAASVVMSRPWITPSSSSLVPTW